VYEILWANLFNLLVPPDWMDLASNIQLVTRIQELKVHKSPAAATFVNEVKNIMS
jgi:hypothetical protein